MHREKHFYFKMLITFEPNVAQRSVASQNDHKSKACLPEASNTAFTMYEAPFLEPFFWRLTALVQMVQNGQNGQKWSKFVQNGLKGSKRPIGPKLYKMV